MTRQASKRNSFVSLKSGLKKNSTANHSESIDMTQQQQTTTNPLTRGVAGSTTSLKTNFMTRSNQNLSNPSESEDKPFNRVNSTNRFDGPSSAPSHVDHNSEDSDLMIVNNHNMHKFYATRLKHSLIISFLLLVPIQNFFLCLISQFSDQVKQLDLVSRLECLVP